MPRTRIRAPGAPVLLCCLLPSLLIFTAPPGAVGPPGLPESDGIPVVGFFPLGPSLESSGGAANSGQDRNVEGHEPGANLSVHLVTVGRGDPIWERFGHNAIRIRNEDTGREVAYNWGIFSFNQVGFIPRLIKGTMLYAMEPREVGSWLEQERLADRPVWTQELALSPSQKMELLDFVQWNALPENKHYRYDYYRDNCSTRVRDALDRVLGGGLRSLSEGDTTAHTYRWHTRRLLRDVPAAYLGIQTVLGPSADRPLTAWEESFLPLRLMEEVRRVEVPDGQGGTRPLVVQERLLLESTRPPEPTEPPAAFAWFLLAGILWSGGILLLSRPGTRRGFLGRLGLTALAGGWALLASVGGTLLLGAWLFTDHVFWYQNQNLLQMNPLFLPVAVAFCFFLFRGSFPRWARDLTAALGVLAGVGFVMGLLPGMGQANGEILAFTVPVNGALVLGSLWAYSGDGTPNEVGREGARAPDDGLEAP